MTVGGRDDQRGTALVVAHEVLGPNEHGERVAARFRRGGCTVLTPNFLTDGEVYRSTDEKAAYASFTATLGVTGMADALESYARELRADYERVVCLGFSVGATAAWLASATGVFDAVACFYGSRIRDHADILPLCSCLAVFAAHEASFDPRALVERLSGRQHVTVELYDCRHGFCDEDSVHHDAEASRLAFRNAARMLGLT